MDATAGSTTVVVDSTASHLTVERDGRPLIEGEVCVRLGDGATVGLNSGDPSLTTTADIDAVDGAVDVTLSVTNESDAPRRLVAFDLIDGTASFGGDSRVFTHGYQSWSPTATLSLGERFPPESPAARPQMVDLTASEDALTSHGLTALSGEPGTVSLGFLDHERYLSRFEIRAPDSEFGTTFKANCPGDGIELAPGESLSSATLRIDATRSVPGALNAVTETIANRMGACVPDHAPTGWCSWYHYFTDVTAEDVRANLDALETWDVEFDVVQLDDGYEVAFGDWRTLDAGFDDMASLREDIVTAGYTPGLWLAPFYVQADSALASEHPEWLVSNDGEPVDAGARHGPMYALDTTHPAVEDWLRTTFETVVEEWGFEYLKLDFLYAAALPGDRAADVTRATAYRRGLEIIRDVVDETFVLGCGAPQFASVGLVDAMRVGPDTAPYWRRAGESASQPAYENAIRNVLNRQFMHRRLWLNDPDCQLLRSTTELTSAERESFATVVALTGGTNVLSDALAEIDDDGRTLFERTLPPTTGGTVRGVGDRELPDRIVCERSADGAVAIAGFNWTAEPQTIRIDPTTYTESDEMVTWVALDGSHDGRGYLTPLEDHVVETTVPSHGTVLVHSVPSPSEARPVLVGAHHLANGTSQVRAVDWQEGTLQFDLDADRPMQFVVTTPEGWRLAETATTESGETVTVTATPGENHFEFTIADEGV